MTLHIYWILEWVITECSILITLLNPKEGQLLEQGKQVAEQQNQSLNQINKPIGQLSNIKDCVKLVLKNLFDTAPFWVSFGLI